MIFYSLFYFPLVDRLTIVIFSISLHKFRAYLRLIRNKNFKLEDISIVIFRKTLLESAFIVIKRFI